MTNHIIIDGWNVCWKIPALANDIPENLERVRKHFGSMIANHFRSKRVIYKIIYDGQPGIYSFNSRKTNNELFSSNPEKADDLILKYLGKQKRAKDWTVITSDNQLSQRCKNIGSEIISSETFISKLNKARQLINKSEIKIDPEIKKEDISYWLKKFNLNNSD